MMAMTILLILLGSRVFDEILADFVESLFEPEFGLPVVRGFFPAVLPALKDASLDLGLRIDDWSSRLLLDVEESLCALFCKFVCLFVALVNNVGLDPF